LSLPLVAIVGRPNVGKSTLVNRIIASREAIVHEEPGVTRDRNYVQTDWQGQTFTIVDTGGLELDAKTDLRVSVTKQALLAVEEAKVIIFVVDAQTALTSEDEEIAKVLRRTEKPVLLVVNKVDNPERQDLIYPFFSLGLGEPLPISALHGLGIGELLDKVVSFIPSPTFPTEKEAVEIRVAIVGRPNVGKSSIFNCLLGQERAIVSELPGTTRDAIDTLIKVDGKVYRFIDTAGLKRKAKLQVAVEYYSLVRALKAIDHSDISLIVLDAQEGVTQQDQRIAGLVEERGSALVVVLNKWDLVRSKRQEEELFSELHRKFRFVDYAPVLKTSALTGQGIQRIFKVIDEVMMEYDKRITPADLNNLVLKLKAEGYMPVKRGRRLKLNYGVQVASRPPRFVFFVNNPQLISPAYRKYLVNRLRENFSFKGCPIAINFKAKRKSKGL
jgi:GTP-binding protein